jgi:hypothetical protein
VGIEQEKLILVVKWDATKDLLLKEVDQGEEQEVGKVIVDKEEQEVYHKVH